MSEREKIHTHTERDGGGEKEREVFFTDRWMDINGFSFYCNRKLRGCSYVKAH